MSVDVEAAAVVDFLISSLSFSTTTLCWLASDSTCCLQHSARRTGWTMTWRRSERELCPTHLRFVFCPCTGHTGMPRTSASRTALPFLQFEAG